MAEEGGLPVFTGAVPERLGQFEYIHAQQCPLDVKAARNGGVAPWMAPFFRMARAYRAGFLPVAGGYLAQPAIVMDTVDEFIVEQDQIEAAQRDVRRAKNNPRV
jgi:hypothetical protein